MGSLHKGHMSLIESSKKKCKKTIVSIFVNPSQFNKKSDFKSYPKSLSNDLRKLKKQKIDYVLIPKLNEIYKNKKEMKIKISNKNKILCAKYRKGHFEGVLAVINKLLRIIKAKYIFLGEKDYQQAYLIKNFIKKKFKTKIIIAKTIRNNNYFPYSSRNKLLKKRDLSKAHIVSKQIRNFYKQIKKNYKNINMLKNVKKNILKLEIKIEYLEIRNKFNLSSRANKNNFKIFIAYYLNNVRLIDNF